MRQLPATLCRSLPPLALAACAGFAPPSAATLAGLPGSAPGPVAVRFEVVLDAPGLSGVFDAVLAVTPDPDPGAAYVRLQLFPEIGGKVLDLAVTGGAIEGEVTTAGAYRCPIPVPADAAPHPCLLLGVALRERFAAITAERVLGERPAGAGVELSLRPVVGGGRVWARLASGVIESRSFAYGPVEFELGRDGTVRAPGFSARLEWGGVLPQKSPNRP